MSAYDDIQYLKAKGIWRNCTAPEWAEKFAKLYQCETTQDCVLLRGLECEIELLRENIDNLCGRLDVASHFCDIRKCVKCKGYYADGYVCSCGYDSSGENE